MTTAPTAPPTAEAFLAEPSTDEDEAVETFTGVLVDTGDPLESMAASLRTIADALMRPMAVRDAEAADAHGEELRLLGEAYDDLEAKHRSLYDLLAEVEKIVKPSTSKLANSVRDAINAWRNPTVDEMVEPEPGSVGAPYTDEEIAALRDHGVQTLEQPAADAPIEEWREYALLHGVDGANEMNRSQIRTALGLSHFEG